MMMMMVVVIERYLMMIMITLMIDMQDDYDDHDDLDKHLNFQPIDLRSVAQTCSRLSEVIILISLIINIIIIVLPFSPFSPPHLCMMWTKFNEKEELSALIRLLQSLFYFRCVSLSSPLEVVLLRFGNGDEVWDRGGCVTIGWRSADYGFII